MADITTPATKYRDVAEAHPQLKDVLALHSYHWDTPAYRGLCYVLGLDPDCGRPVFRSLYEESAKRLLQAANTRFTEKPAERHANGKTTETMLHILDLMRADLRPDPSMLDNARRNWPDIDEAALPDADELKRLVFGDALLDISAEQHRSNGPLPYMTIASIQFLPSRFGTGFRASLYGHHGDYASDGWVDGDYGSLRGIAMEPDPADLEASSWLKVVRRRLGMQGVIFLPRSQLQHYLDTEGVFWLGNLPRSAFRLEMRAVSWFERSLWRLKRPPLPLDDRLAAKAGRTNR